MIKEIIEPLMQLLADKDIVILGIDGLGGAGKSTISESVAQELENKGICPVLLHIDDFIHTKQIRYNDAYEQWQCYYDLQWRYDHFIETLNKLRSAPQQSVQIELYDKDDDCYFSKEHTVSGKTVVIVEGIFLQRKELAGQFDYMVYIDIPEQVRLERVLKRDTYIGNEQQIIDKYEIRYFPAERRYFSEYSPDKSADYVICQ